MDADATPGLTRAGRALVWTVTGGMVALVPAAGYAGEWWDAAMWALLALCNHAAWRRPHLR